MPIAPRWSSKSSAEDAVRFAASPRPKAIESRKQRALRGAGLRPG